jgi:hypothetical protein
MKRAIAVFLLVALATVVAPAQGRPAAPSTPQDALYSLSGTARCLKSRGAIVAPIRPRNSRLRALRDLAQKTSREVRVVRKIVGVAFLPTAGRAELLVELLTVPKDPYRIQRRNNVVLVARPSDRSAAAFVLGCLRSGSDADLRTR